MKDPKITIIRSGFLALAIFALVVLTRCASWGIEIENQASTGAITFVERALRAQFCLLAVVGSVVLLTGALWGWIAFEVKEKNSSAREISMENQRAPLI
ncbi:MAG: hypothetical protein ACFFAS_02605 [Promethearchaeota archaeon]